MPLVLGALAFLATIVITFLIVGIDMVSKNPGTVNPRPFLIGGLTISAALFASYWIKIGWW